MKFLTLSTFLIFHETIKIDTYNEIEGKCKATKKNLYYN